MNGNNFSKINIGLTLRKIANRNTENLGKHHFNKDSKDLFIFEKMSTHLFDITFPFLLE